MDKATEMVPLLLIGIPVLIVLVLVFRFVTKSFNMIGPSEVGLVTKRWGKKMPNGQLIALDGEAGYQAELLTPGLRFKLWPIFIVEKYSRVQVPPGCIGLVIAQEGAPLEIGAKSADYKSEFGAFENVRTFLNGGGQRGVQRPVLTPGTSAAIHPVAFIVVTPTETFGEIVSDATQRAISEITASELKVTLIEPPTSGGDVVGVVTVLEGPSAGAFASRLNGFADILELETNGAQIQTSDDAPSGVNATTDGEAITRVLSSKNHMHSDYQDIQAFLDAGGHSGLQHDTLPYGAYALNPLLVRVETHPMLVVTQGEVAVIKSSLGLPTMDTSGEEFKFGSIVMPGHQGIWREPLRTGKYALNPRIYTWERVPTSILTLNWANASSEAHDLDARLSPIEARSSEAFVFMIDLQVQIHVPDTMAPKVISMVGTMKNLVDEVLQSAVGNHFRNKIQSLQAKTFISTRSEVQQAAQQYIIEYLHGYNVEVKGVYIQGVILPEELVHVLTQREIAAQEKQTFVSQQEAQQARVALERQRGEADQQANLAAAEVSVQIKKAEADASIEEARGKAEVTSRVGQADAGRIKAVGDAEAAVIEAKGLAQAKGYKAQQDAIGSDQTALVAALKEIGDGHIKVTPEIMVGAGAGGILDGIGSLFMQKMANSNGHSPNGQAALSGGTTLVADDPSAPGADDDSAS